MPQRQTKGQLAEQVVPRDYSFDYALPQHWVDAMYERGQDVVPHFVWVYPRSGGDVSMFGFPYPLTEEGKVMLCRVAAGIH